LKADKVDYLEEEEGDEGTRKADKVDYLEEEDEEEGTRRLTKWTTWRKRRMMKGLEG
jgi:hypothetical protein